MNAQQPSSQQIDKAIGEALDAFWAKVTENFPEIQTGDVLFDDPFVDQATEAVARWYANNAG